jgi:dTDP-4-dehydrorhamnose 3,5-epimerase
MSDQRGSFTELWRASHTSGLEAEDFVQANLSRSREGVLRGMHFHRRQADLWVLIEGRALAASTDLRSLSAGGAGSVVSQLVELAAGDALYIPSLVAHGFWALEDAALLYLVSREYDGTDEYGFAWNDPDAAIAWPTGEPIMSDRDRNNPSLAEVARQWGQHSSSR